jgi:hypothetical protein
MRSEKLKEVLSRLFDRLPGEFEYGATVICEVIRYMPG